MCHSAIYEQYKASVHGAALVGEDNPDVPDVQTVMACILLMIPGQPSSAASPELCGGCHRDEQMMGKYGISTDVFNTYVSDFHGTTVTLFEKQSPDQATNKAVCFDCHGIHNIKLCPIPKQGSKGKSACHLPALSS